MSSTFANKLFNRLDNGLIYDKTETYEITTKEAPHKTYNFSIDGNILYFNPDMEKNIYSLDLKSGVMSASPVKITGKDINGFQVIGKSILYHDNSDKVYKTSIDNNTETEVNDIDYIIGKNSDNYIMYVNGSGKIGYITDINDLSKRTTEIARTGIINFNNKYIISCEYNSKTIYIHDLFSDVNKTSFEFSTFSNNIDSCFCNDEMFCVVESSTYDIYILSVEDFEKGATVADWHKVKTITNIMIPLLSNNYFVYIKSPSSDKNIYYSNSKYLLNESGTYNEHYSQTELLYSIDKKLDILQQLLEQFIPPSN